MPNPFLECTQPPPPPVEIDREEEYEILEILNFKIDKWRKCKLQYLVRWLGYEGTDEESSWIPANEVHTSKAISDFHTSHPDKPGPIEHP